MHRLTKKEEHRIGMRVKLTHPRNFYRINKGNPVVDTEYECAGSIDEILGNSEFVCRVLWDNKHRGSYHNGTLSICEEDEFISIW